MKTQKEIPEVVEKRARTLAELIAYHQKRYHEEDSPEISDEAYDSLVAELIALQTTYPELKKRHRETQNVGGRPVDAFKKVKHRVRQWSFDNVFTDTELREWEERLLRVLEREGVGERPTFVSEHKIDGLKLVLEYERGALKRASTRGDGEVGEDVTHTAMTIRDVPHHLTQPVTLIAVGEVWLSREEFERINSAREARGEQLFANPRNAAAGSLRQLDPSVTKERKLSFFAYDIDYVDPETGTAPLTQVEELALLHTLGFTTNQHATYCKDLDAVLREYHRSAPKKRAMPYGMDGTVVKVNEVWLQNTLGYTAKSPRFGIAYKFPSEESTTVLEDIVLQVGRTGVLTPVAHLRPVRIAGSLVSRATLHNEDQIKRLDVRIGDTVILHKAGDVIPEIQGVLLPLRPKSAKPYRFPKKVPECGGDGSIERVPGMSAWRCVAKDSDVLHRQRLYHFVSRGAMNIDGVGPKIIDLFLEHNLINSASDLFTLTEGDFLDLPGFKEKSAENTIQAIARAKTVPLDRFLIALSIEHVGEETARVIAEAFSTIGAIQGATREELARVFGIGEIVAESVVAWMRSPAHRHELDMLLAHVRPTAVERAKNEHTALSGKVVVFTGTLPTLGRSQAEAKARACGAHPTSSVSKQTDYVIVGSEAGTKAETARRLGISCISEAEFLKLCGRGA